MAKKQKLRRSIAAIMAITLVAGTFPVQPVSELIMPKLSVSAAETASTAGVAFKDMSIVVGGKLGVNFSLQVEDSFQYADTAYVKVSCAGQEISRVKLSDVESVNNIKKIEANIPAKQMTDTITAEVFINDSATTAVKSVSTSVKKYADYLLANSKDTKVKEVVKAMLNYGAYSQKTFNYKTTKLANADLTETEKNAVSSVTADTVSNYQSAVIVPKPAVGTLATISLELQSEISLKVSINIGSNTASFMKFQYFNGNEMVDISDVEFNTEGNTTIATLTINDIPVKSLGKDIIISATNGSKETMAVKCSALTYAKSAMNTTDAKYENVRNTAAALYLYNQAAINYFDSAREAFVDINGDVNDYTKHTYDAGMAYEENGKFYITIPATCKDATSDGFGNIEINTISSNRKTPVLSENFKIFSQGGISVIAIDKSAVPTGASIDVATTVASTAELTNSVTNGTIVSNGLFVGEKFEATIVPDETYSLPDSITVKMKSSTSAGGYSPVDSAQFTYDKTTGKIVIKNVTGDVEISGTCVSSNAVTVVRLTGIQADFPSVVGESFKTTLNVTDSTKYELPKQLTIISSKDAKIYGFNTKRNNNGEIIGYTPIEECTIKKIKYEVGETYLPATAVGEASAKVPNDTYYIYDVDSTTNKATLEVKNISGEELYITATANKFFNVTTEFDGVEVKSIGDSTTNKTLPATVTENSKYLDGAEIKLGLDKDATAAGGLIVPSSIDVYVNGKKIEAKVSDTVTNYTYTPAENGQTATLKFDRALTGNIKIVAAASEYCNLTTTLGNGLALNPTAGRLSTGDVDLILSTTNKNYSLPSAITVTLNGTVLTAGQGYIYNSTTGKITVAGLKKSDNLNIKASGVNTFVVSVTGDGKVIIPSYATSVKTGEVWSVKLTPDMTKFPNSDAAVEISSITVNGVAIKNNPIVDGKENTKPYYTFNEETGLLEVHNINGKVVVTVAAKERYSIEAVSNGSQDAANYVTSVTLAQTSMFKDTPYKSAVSAVLTTNEKQLEITGVYTVDSTGKKTTLGNPLGGEPGTEYDKDHKFKLDTNITSANEKYTAKWYYANGTLSIASGINSNIVVEYTAVNAIYKYDKTNEATLLKNITVVNKADDLTYGSTYTTNIVPTDPDNYKVPANIIVRMGGEVLDSSKYTYTFNNNDTPNEPSDDYAILTVPKVSGNITVEAYADSKVTAYLSSLSSITHVNNTTSNKINIGTVNYDLNDQAAYGSDYAVDISLTGADAYKYSVSGVTVTMDGNDNPEYTLINNTLTVKNVTGYVTITGIKVSTREHITIAGIGDVYVQDDGSYKVKDNSGLTTTTGDGAALYELQARKNVAYADGKWTEFTKTNATVTVENGFVTITGIPSDYLEVDNSEYRLVEVKADNTKPVVNSQTVTITSDKYTATDIYNIELDNSFIDTKDGNKVKVSVGEYGTIYGKITVNPDLAWKYDLPTSFSWGSDGNSSATVNSDGTFKITNVTSGFNATVDPKVKTAVAHVKVLSGDISTTFYKQADGTYIGENLIDKGLTDETPGAYILNDNSGHKVEGATVAYNNTTKLITITMPTGTDLAEYFDIVVAPSSSIKE